MLNFMTESTKDFEETTTIGSFSQANSKNDFDAVYKEAYEDIMVQNINPMTDINMMIKDESIMESFKENLLRQLKEDCDAFAANPDAARYASLYENASALIDNCTSDFIKESTRVGTLLPIKAVDYPIIIKQNLALACKDIIQTEVTKSPVVKKHIERRWITDKKSGQRWEYPQCLFKGEFKDIFAAGKGFPISEDPVDITGGLFNFNIVSELTSGDAQRDYISANTQITKVVIGATEAGQEDVIIPVSMRINMSDGSWLGGKIYDPEDNKTLIDVLTGSVDFTNNTTTLTSASGKVTAVVFSGYLSNELNERTVSFDRTREEYEWKIEDGFRADIPYSLEQLEDSKALLDIDLYQLTYNDLSDILVQMEDMQILQFLDDQYDKFDGVELDPLGFNPFICKQVFDCDSSTQTVALQSEYIQKMLKFYVDRFVTDICDTAKIENVTFVVYGNPRYISLLDPEVNWVVKAGDSVGGVKLNYSYGVMNAAGMKIQVVSTYKYDNKDNRKLRFIPFPLSDDQFTFKHYKYTTHILTAQNSGYRDASRPGGSYTYLMGTTRNVTAAIQGIQGSMTFKNTPFILNGYAPA